MALAPLSPEAARAVSDLFVEMARKRREDLEAQIEILRRISAGGRVEFVWPEDAWPSSQTTV